MEYRRYILPFIFLALITTVSRAQESAQATMRVSVKVVSGYTATVNTDDMGLQIDTSDIKGNFGSVELSGVNRGDVLISSDGNLNLTNKEGHKVLLPVEKRTVSDYKNLGFYFSGSERIKEGDTYKGVYNGTLSTTIEYL